MLARRQYVVIVVKLNLLRLGEIVLSAVSVLASRLISCGAATARRSLIRSSWTCSTSTQMVTIPWYLFVLCLPPKSFGNLSWPSSSPKTPCRFVKHLVSDMQWRPPGSRCGKEECVQPVLSASTPRPNKCEEGGAVSSIENITCACEVLHKYQIPKSYQYITIRFGHKV